MKNRKKLILPLALVFAAIISTAFIATSNHDLFTDENQDHDELVYALNPAENQDLTPLELKCGEGKCGGDDKKADKKEAKSESKESNCSESKCGDGKSEGDTKTKESETKEGESKCGEGKCGG
ncbi:MAG TPA: hypothetical protein DDX98_01870 [Bacteroidales bacterium]|jgi:uncharacterized low-complexity protein|nr:hypothetical protein [Bacteroidales bacterium]